MSNFWGAYQYLSVTKLTPCSTGGKKIALSEEWSRQEKTPWYSRSGLPTTQLKYQGGLYRERKRHK